MHLNAIRTKVVAAGLVGLVLAGSVTTGGIARAVTADDGTSRHRAGGDPPSGVIASFEGGWLDLSVSWGDATACHVTMGGVDCYRTEAEMDEAEGLTSFGLRAGTPETGTRAAGVRAAAAALVTCSSTLRLYRSSSYGGGVLALSTRGVVMNLSGYGFDNDTSSYKVGACSSTFWENASASGSVYPGLTVANVSSPSMVAGWDNRVSSVYIS